MAKTPRNSSNSSRIELGEVETVTPNLDPHLQDIVLKRREGKPQDPRFTAVRPDGRVMVDVIAKLKDPDSQVPGLDVVRKIGNIVTGQVEADRIEEVRTNGNVTSLKRAIEVKPELSFSVAEIQATPSQLQAGLPGGSPAIDGRDVIVGIVDFDLDFVHRNFRNADGSTRVLFLWDQTGPETSLSPAGFPYGREFKSAAINAALNSGDPYFELGYRPEPQAHGTHVTDIAAGNGNGSGVAGVAPGADIIFVQLTGGDFADTESFGNSRTLLEAVDYIFEKAASLGRPAVVNLSLGTHGGPHDGTTLAEQAFDALLETPGRAITIAAGNSRDARGHVSGQIAAGASATLQWKTPQFDFTSNEVEVWYPGAERLEVTLVTPSGQRLGPVAPDSTRRLQSNGNTVGRIIHRAGDPNNGDNQIDILLGREMPVGVYQVELHATDGPVQFHAWIERDDFGQSTFLGNDVQAHTIGSISCGRGTIVVGSYNALLPGRDLSSFSSEGPTRDGRQKPDVSAPGQGIVAANSLTQGTVRMSGTSMAAPHVAGLIALIMQTAGRNLANDEMRDLVIDACRENPPAGSLWHPRYGFGRVDAKGSVSLALPRLPSMAQPAAIAAAAAAATGQQTLTALPPVDGWIHEMADAASNAKARIRVQMEIEPIR